MIITYQRRFVKHIQKKKLTLYINFQKLCFYNYYSIFKLLLQQKIKHKTPPPDVHTVQSGGGDPIDHNY